MKQAYSPEWHDVFLSHTRADREQAEQLAEQLRAAGLSVYLDVDDEALSRLHGRELAERLKNILSRSRLLLFVFSARSTESRWMPWELGLAHGVVGRVLLWPLNAAAGRAAARQEYLKLYEQVNATHPLEDVLAHVYSARDAAVAPAHEHAAAALGEITGQQGLALAQPAHAWEFGWRGPWQLYMAWWQALWGTGSRAKSPHE